MDRIIHSLVQGSPEWLAHRRQFLNASDAPAMMGVSSYRSRAELLRERATGVAPEVDAMTQRLFDSGHRFEALARPLAEELIGEDLYPVSMTFGNLGASLDGINLAGEVIWEHKRLNNSLRGVSSIDELGLEYRVQMEQQLHVSGASRCLFTASDWTEDGELIEAKHIWYESDPKLREAIIAGWRQFEADVSDYTPVEAAVASVGRAPDSLPALRIEVSGLVTASNLEQFKAHALTVFSGINRDLQTDQDFADAEKTVKWCGDVEDRLKSAKAHALSQTESIDALFRAIDDIAAEARATRLELEKLVKARKDAVREEIRQAAVNALRGHYARINSDLDAVELAFPVTFGADVAAAMKGKKTVASLRDAADSTLATAKIEANRQADGIRARLTWFRENAKDFEFLFADLQQLIGKADEDFQLAINNRIERHKQEEAAKKAAPAAPPVATAAAPQAHPEPFPAPTNAPAAPAPAAKRGMPSAAAIVSALASYYQVSEATARSWLCAYDFAQLSNPLEVAHG